MLRTSAGAGSARPAQGEAIMGRKSVHAHVAEDVTPAEAWNRLRERCLRSRVAVDEGGELELVLYRLAKWLDRLERSTSLTVVQVEVLAEVIETAVEAGRESGSGDHARRAARAWG